MTYKLDSHGLAANFPDAMLKSNVHSQMQRDGCITTMLLFTMWAGQSS